MQFQNRLKINEQGKMNSNPYQSPETKFIALDAQTCLLGTSPDTTIPADPRDGTEEALSKPAVFESIWDQEETLE